MQHSAAAAALVLLRPLPTAHPISPPHDHFTLPGDFFPPNAHFGLVHDVNTIARLQHSSSSG